jgi:hypothetical protein
MASHLTAKPIPSFIAALPFLFARPQQDDLGWSCRSALASAVAAERADDRPRNTRGRIAYVLCELGYQLARRGLDACGELPLSRTDIARSLGVSLSRVKRALALFELSQVVEGDGQRIRILDWHRLCGVAGYDPRRLELASEEDEGPAPARDNGPSPQLTAAGDQACFV